MRKGILAFFLGPRKIWFCIPTPLQKVFFWLSFIIARLVLRLFFNFQAEGSQNIPQGQFLLVANHQAYLDLVAVYLGLSGKVIPRFVARTTLWIGPYFMFTVPIDRQNFSKSDFRRVCRAVESGDVLGIFPRGTTKDEGEWHPLVAVLARKYDLPILPIRIIYKGPRRNIKAYLMRRTNIAVIIGRAFKINDLGGAAKEKVMEEIKTRVYEL